MLPLAALTGTNSVFANPDWTSLGIVTAMVGAFLIASATLLEHPRRLVARYFGRQSGRLQSVREYVYNRLQVVLGFAFLLFGFGMQLVGHFLSLPPGAEPLNMAWVGVIVTAVVGMLFAGWWWSLWAFRRYVREYFTEHQAHFEQQGNLAREIGELFGVEPSANDTVATYAARVRKAADLPKPTPQSLRFPIHEELEGTEEAF
ncbi:MAG: hypothetical protein H6829_03800 [Planctomycetes bacterium]|nr:hypothetical protein [Planctomycetota bacterium]HRV81993.1 hypothetical protein [Planctomycetota bacterium]